MIKVCVFDLDGTLLNTLPTIAHHVNRTLMRYGIAPYGVEEYRAFVGNGARNLLRRALAGRGVKEIDFEAFYRDYMESYDAAPSHLTVPYEGVRELLSFLKSRGVPLAVLSNKPDSSIQLLIEDFFPDTFDFVRGARAGAPLKPAPDALFEILDTFGATPEECFYVGDGIPDMRLAKNASVSKAVAALWGFTDADELLGEGGIGAGMPYEVKEIFCRYE